MTGSQGALPRFEWNAGSVRAMRRFLGMSQSMFAAELGVRQQTVSEWETGMYRPRGASATLLNLVAASSGFMHEAIREANAIVSTGTSAVTPTDASVPAAAAGSTGTGGVGASAVSAPSIAAMPPVRLPVPPQRPAAFRPEVAI